MAEKEIKRRIVLEGEKEYSAALKEVGRNLKTLKSELKAETAELGANATQQQKNEVKMKSLQKQIKEQEKAVKTYQEALKEVKEHYSDNEDAIAKWETKLNDARATLANMRNSLADLNQGIQGTNSAFSEAASSAAATVTATKSVADTLESLGDIGEGVSSAIENIFSGMLDTVTDIAQQMWNLISKTAEKANGWTDTANIWGTDPQTIQQYTRALEGQGKSFSDLETIVNKIVYGGKGKKITELLGISGVNYRGYNDWDYAMVVMDKIYDMQQRGKNMNPIYEEIFGGKNATKAIDLINGWDKIKGSLDTYNGNITAYGMSDKELEYMDDLWVKINTIETKFDALKDKFAAGLGMATGTLLVNVEGGLDAIEKFMSAETPEEREAALEDLRKNVEEFFTKVGEILEEGIKILGQVGEELQESDDPVVHAIGDILTALKESLEWMVNNQDDVKAAFEAIFGVWLLAKLGAVAGKLTSIIAQIKVIEGFKGLGGAAAAGNAAAGGAAAGAASAATGTATTAGTPLGGLLNALGIGALFKTGMEASEQLGTGIYGALYQKTNPDYKPIEIAGYMDEQGNIIEKTAPTGEPRRKKVITGTADESSMMGYIPDTAPGPTQAQRDAAEAFWDIFRQNFGDVPDSAFDDLEEAFQGNQDLFDKLDTLIDKLSEHDSVDDSWRNMEDLPANWWLDADKWQNSGNANGGNAITSSDLQNFRSLPAGIAAAARAGTAEGISNIKVVIDGYAAGRLLAPYISEYIAQDIMG